MVEKARHYKLSNLPKSLQIERRMLDLEHRNLSLELTMTLAAHQQFFNG